MYFPTSAARHLSVVPAFHDVSPEPIIAFAPSPRRFLFCILTKDAISLWRVRPYAPLAHLARTTTSLREHGDNARVCWSPDGRRVVVESTLSYLVLISVEHNQDKTVYRPPNLAPSAERNFLPGPGECLPLPSFSLRLEGVIRVEGHLLAVSARKRYLLLSTKHPPAIQQVPWPSREEPQSEDCQDDSDSTEHATWTLNDDEEFHWLVDTDAAVCKIWHGLIMDAEVWLTSDGRLYYVRLLSFAVSDVGDFAQMENVDGEGRESPDQYQHSIPDPSSPDTSTCLSWRGSCIYDFETPKWVQKQRRLDHDQVDGTYAPYLHPQRAVEASINTEFSIIAIGIHDGSIIITDFPTLDGGKPPSQDLQVPVPHERSGSVCALEWSSDGYVLAVGWQHGWAIYSVGGRCLAWAFGVEAAVDGHKFQDVFMHGIDRLFWGPGNFELFVLARCPPPNRGGLFVIPFAKSATTGQHSPDNTRYAFLQMDDRCLVYRGADQPDLSVINPESDVWQTIKIPQSYISTNWPILYSSLSSDGRLVAVAGQRGLTHYSSTSGRWKVFADERQQQAFTVKGGMIWFHHVLIAAVEVARSHQIRLYSRDLELSNNNVLHREMLASPVVILSLVDNSLLVYTADNALLHFLIVPTSDTVKLHLCGSISFDGMIATPGAVRLLSWMIPTAQKQLGDPAGDLSVATVLMVVGGQLVLLRPRRSQNQQVKYDMLIFADRIEFCWTHLQGIGALENSLWGYDGKALRVWLNALSIEPTPSDDPSHTEGSIKESVSIPLDFYPLSVLMDKGIIIGVEYEATTRSNITFVIFRRTTSSHLFLHHILLFHLAAGQVSQAVLFASHYQRLVYFAHALEILLHNVVESESTTEGDEKRDEEDICEASVLPAAVEFLDHFDAALDVVVGCARKTEMTRWRRLFSSVGDPKLLFETCLKTHRLKTAASYLLVLHNLEQLDERNGEVVRFLRGAIAAQDWQLCRDVLRFIHSIDDTGQTLRNVLEETGLIEASPATSGVTTADDAAQ